MTATESTANSGRCSCGKSKNPGDVELPRKRSSARTERRSRRSSWQRRFAGDGRSRRQSTENSGARVSAFFLFRESREIERGRERGGAGREREERRGHPPYPSGGSGARGGRTGSTREGVASSSVATAGEVRDDRDGFAENPLKVSLPFANWSSAF